MDTARQLRPTEISAKHQYFPEFGAPATFSYDFRHGIQVSMLPNANGTTVNWTDPNSFVFDFANDDVFLNKDYERYAEGKRTIPVVVLEPVS